MNRSLDYLLQDASSFIKSEFNLQLEKSQLKIYSSINWQKFCQINGFDINSEGLYIPFSYSAYVKVDSPVLVSNIFHELYGHGLFCEHSQIGKKLADIIQNQDDEKSFLYNEIDPQKQPLGLCKTNIGNYEGFAIWLEALLCEVTNNSKVWQIKKEKLPSEFISLFEFFQEAEQKLSRFGLIAQLGFPKFYNKDKVLDIVKRLYGSTFKNIDFIILYGSRKPESDIDLFIVSSNPSMNYFNGWLDIYEVNREEFFHELSYFDISITDPLFSGEVIYGDKNFVQRIKENIKNTPITDKAIKYNLAEAKKQKELLKYISRNDKRFKDCISYIESFTRNAEQLSLGNKPLTLKNLQEIYKD